MSLHNHTIPVCEYFLAQPLFANMQELVPTSYSEIVEMLRLL